MLGTVDAYPKINAFLGKERAPCFVDQCPIRLKRVRHRQIRRLQSINESEGVAVEVYRQDHWFACVPDDRKPIRRPARCKHLGEKIDESLFRDDRPRTPIRKIAIRTVYVTKRCRLHDK